MGISPTKLQNIIKDEKVPVKRVTYLTQEPRLTPTQAKLLQEMWDHLKIHIHQVGVETFIRFALVYILSKNENSTR